MILNLCYRGKQVKETMYKIMLQETVWTLSNTQRHLRQASIIKRSLLNHVLGVLACVASLACFVLGVRACLLWWNVLCSYVFAYLCAFLSYLLYISILKFKILTAKNLCALNWTYFLFIFWYQLIKLFETNLREAGKSINI